MKRTWTITSACLLASSLAWAQPKTPDELYREGENQYNLGNFDKAVESFKAGFELETVESKKSAYLFNIAQSYRQMKECVQAQFFFKRFISMKEADRAKPLKPAMRAQVEKWIAELDGCAREQREQEEARKAAAAKAAADKPADPAKPEQPTVAAKPDPTDGDDDGDGDGDGISRTLTGPAGPVAVRLSGGGAKLSTGDLTVPVQATAALVGGYPLRLSDKLTLEVGGAFTLTPVAYRDAVMDESRTAQLIGALANAGATYEVAPKIGVRGDLGLGLLFFGNAGGSPFTNYNPTSGALAMFHVRAAVSGDYAITPNLVATVTPVAFSFSPAKAGLREDISSITAIDFMVGIGYRM